MAKHKRVFKAANGTQWGVEVRMPTASNAMVVFNHPSGQTSGLNRYAWYQWQGPEARSVTSRVSSETVMKSLSDDLLAVLFRRSMPVSPGATPLADVLGWNT